jgi:steroid delta-isomerase-like uncharacterized protein
MSMQDKGSTHPKGQTSGNGHLSQPGNAHDNEALARKFIATGNEHNVSKVLPLLDEHVSLTSMPTNKTYQGHQGFTEYLSKWLTASPDFRAEVTSVVATDDKCVIEFTCRGTHAGPLELAGKSYPATNKRFELKLSETCEIANGKLMKIRSYFDAAGMLTQLGLMPKV